MFGLRRRRAFATNLCWDIGIGPLRQVEKRRNGGSSAQELWAFACARRSFCLPAVSGAREGPQRLALPGLLATGPEQRLLTRSSWASLNFRTGLWTSLLCVFAVSAGAPEAACQGTQARMASHAC